MRLNYTAADFTQALQQLLPQGRAWQWAEGSLGWQLLAAPAEALARIQAEVPAIIADAPAQHQPAYSSWTLADYQQIADPTGLLIQVARIKVAEIDTFAVDQDVLWDREQDRCSLLIYYDVMSYTLAELAGLVPPLQDVFSRLLAHRQAHTNFVLITRGGPIHNINRHTIEQHTLTPQWINLSNTAGSWPEGYAQIHLLNAGSHPATIHGDALLPAAQYHLHADRPDSLPAVTYDARNTRLIGYALPWPATDQPNDIYGDYTYV